MAVVPVRLAKRHRKQLRRISLARKTSIGGAVRLLVEADMLQNTRGERTKNRAPRANHEARTAGARARARA